MISNKEDREYILVKLKEISARYGYKSYSILISDNETKLKIDKEIDHLQL